MAQNWQTSVGEELPGRVGLQTCWRAINHVWSTWENSLQALVKIELVDNQEDSLFEGVGWSVFMVGLMPAHAKPTIFILRGRDSTIRKKAVELVRGIPEVTQQLWLVKQRKRSPETRGSIRRFALGEGSLIETMALNTGPVSLPVFYKPWTPAFGQQIWFRAPTDDGAVAWRKSTGGGICRSEDKYYYLTVAHIIDNSVLSFLDEVDSEGEDSDHDDSDSENAVLLVDEQEITSRGSMSPEPSGSYDTSLSSESNQSRGAAAHMPPPTVTTPTLSEPSIESQSSLLLPPPQPAEQMKTRSSIAAGPSGISELGQTVLMSSRGPRPSLDYALVEISAPRLQTLNAVPLYDREDGTYLYPDRIFSGPLKPAEIVTVTGSGGFKRGHLSGAATYIAQEHKFVQELWSVNIEGTFEDGDCGSWVVNAFTGDFYGQIVAGNGPEGFGYLIPAYMIFEDLWIRHDLSLDLSTSPPPYSPFLAQPPAITIASKMNEAWPAETNVVRTDESFFQGRSSMGLEEKARLHIYRRLKSSGSFRLLIVHPGNLTAELHCELIQVQAVDRSFTRSHAYEAVSWVWGGRRASEILRVHQSSSVISLSIPSEVATLLKSLRRIDRSRALWIDYLCINLSDSDEKNRQVSIIPEIFRNATNVCIWLGESDEESTRAMQFAEHVTRLGYHGDEEMLTARNWRTFNSLISRPWFWRRWVIQEVAYARRATVVCGRHRIEFEDLANVIVLFHEAEQATSRLTEIAGSKTMSKHIASDPLSEFHQLPALQLIDLLSSTVRRDGNGKIASQTSLGELVVLCTSFETGMPQDAVYSLLGLAKDSERFLRKYGIDYSKPTADVFVDFVYHVLTTTTSPEVLDIICKPWAPKLSSNKIVLSNGQKICPSWVRDVSHLAFGKQRNLMTEVVYLRRINADPLVGLPLRPIYAAGLTGSKPSVIFRSTSSYYSICPNGLQISKIGALEKPAYSGQLPRKWLEMGGWEHETQTLPEDFWRTLVADRDHQGKAPALFYLSCCQELFKIWPQASTLLSTDIGDSWHAAGLTERKVLRRLRSVIWNRRLMRTSEGWLGLAPRLAREGDLVCVLFGCSVPVILRRLPRTARERADIRREAAGRIQRAWRAFYVRRQRRGYLEARKAAATRSVPPVFTTWVHHLMHFARNEYPRTIAQKSPQVERLPFISWLLPLPFSYDLLCYAIVASLSSYVLNSYSTLISIPVFSVVCLVLLTLVGRNGDQIPTQRHPADVVQHPPPSSSRLLTGFFSAESEAADPSHIATTDAEEVEHQLKELLRKPTIQRLRSLDVTASNLQEGLIAEELEDLPTELLRKPTIQSLEWSDTTASHPSNDLATSGAVPNRSPAQRRWQLARREVLQRIRAEKILQIWREGAKEARDDRLSERYLPNPDFYYELIGECYVHGIMDGEALRDRRREMRFEIR